MWDVVDLMFGGMLIGWYVGIVMWVNELDWVSGCFWKWLVG